MMTPSVKVQTGNIIGNVGGTASRGKQSATDFDLLINNNRNTSFDIGNTESNAVIKPSVQATDDASVSKKDNPAVNSQKETAQTSVEKTSTSQGTEEKATPVRETDKVSKEPLKVDKQNSDADVPEEIVAQVTALLMSIQEALMKTLNLTPEEFNQLMENQGLSLTDLLQSENLQQFVLAYNGENDILAALTDENLCDMMKQLLQTVEEIKEESNMGLTAEQMKDLLDQAKLQNQTARGVDNLAVKSDVLSKQAENTNEAIAKEDANVTTSRVISQDSSLTEEAVVSSVEETDSNDQADTKGDLKSDIGADRFQTFVDNLAKSTQSSQVNFNGDMARMTQIREIASQIIERVKVSITPQNTSMELQLNPENLGRVNLTVASREGVMTAHFVVQNEISKEAIESQIQTLRDNLNQQGIKVDAIEVSIAANAFEQNSNQEGNNQAEAQKGSAGRKITLDEALGMTELEEDVVNTEVITGTTGSLVDYTA